MLRQRLATEVNRIIAANPQQYELAKTYLARGITLEESVLFLKRCYLAAALRETKCNRVQAARISGTHRNTVSRIIPLAPMNSATPGTIKL